MNPLFRSTRSASLLILVLLSFSLAPIATAQQKTALTDKLLGTWKLVSTKYGDATEFQKYSGDSTRLKMINPTHFIWVEIDSDKKVATSAGGRYTLEGEVYTETIDFCGEGMERFLGKPQKFTIKIEGDRLFQAGDLSNGLHIEENWERVK